MVEVESTVLSSTLFSTTVIPAGGPPSAKFSVPPATVTMALSPCRTIITVLSLTSRPLANFDFATFSFQVPTKGSSAPSNPNPNELSTSSPQTNFLIIAFLPSNLIVGISWDFSFRRLYHKHRRDRQSRTTHAGRGALLKCVVPRRPLG